MLDISNYLQHNTMIGKLCFVVVIITACFSNAFSEVNILHKQQALSIKCINIDDNLSPAFGLNQNAVRYAKELLNHHFGSWKTLCNLSKDELLKKLNFFVYNFCSAGDIKSSDLNSLFKQCISSCTGRAYVLRGLLAVYGIKSQYMNIYTIPIQIAHTAVETEDNMFADPTFGVFFAKNINSLPLSLQQVKYFFDYKMLSKHVYSAKKDHDFTTIFQDLSSMYSNDFNRNGINLNSYIDNEASETINQRNILFVHANLTLKNNQITLGCPDKNKADQLLRCFLKHISNNADIKKNNDSYISSNIKNLGYVGNQMRVNIFNFHKLKINGFYSLTMLIHNPHTINLTLNISSMDNRLILKPKSNLIIIKPGYKQYTIGFLAKSENSSLALYPIPGAAWEADLFALTINAEKRESLWDVHEIKNNN